MSLLSLQNVSLCYDKKPVLEDISFSIEKGENMLIVGSNGAGKTTLLKVLSGLLAPCNGAIVVNGDVVTKETTRTLQKKIAYIPQDLGLIENYTVLQNILLGAVHTLSWWQTLLNAFPICHQSKAEKLITDLSLTELATTKIKHLSGGQKKKVAIARALMLNPEIILTDEMTSDLDHNAAQEVISYFEALQKNHTCSVILVEHHVGHVLGFVDHLITLANHRVAHTVSKEDIPTFLEQYFLPA
jgi:phosphonate transport system ATP-binding protein